MEPSKKVTAVPPGKRKGSGIKYVHHTPFTNIEEGKDVYIFRLAVPGFYRDEMEICVNDFTMCINAKKKCRAPTEVVLPGQKAQYDFTNWKKKFQLPENADPLFSNASYVNGELIVYIPRNTHPLMPACTKIAIY